ncbi:hypothetical protein MSG28_011742 [Choristoneura fumiferana]|uniref:Uncharacterized protein n=1 Tax=Choristoneura fumiferana TaxID=7141 RepID=A0ACC0KLR6_CHOFU|nr:hypothetical protein MSG28_011742 [Choristoneura fumiferana]
MKTILVLLGVVSLVYGRNLGNQLALKNHHRYGFGLKRCVNMWDDGCTNGQLGGAGSDDYYLGGSFNPGKRCVNMWDDGCTNGQLGGSGES